MPNKEEANFALVNEGMKLRFASHFAYRSKPRLGLGWPTWTSASDRLREAPEAEPRRRFSGSVGVSAVRCAGRSGKTGASLVITKRPNNKKTAIVKSRSLYALTNCISVRFEAVHFTRSFII